MADIEISFDMKASVCGRFWIDAEEWSALSQAEKAAKLDAFIDSTNATFDRGDIDVGPGFVYVNAVAIDGDVGVYDPKAEGRE